VRLIDVRHLGRERVIGCWQLDGVLIDPGPESSLATLIDSLQGEAPRALLLTHIHLDHAGGSGALVRRWPELEVYVHERGAPHLANPEKLIASASQLYGDRMERLWGEIVPVPQANLRPLAGGESVLGFRVAYTPGHASHHVCFLHEDSGRAFVGDVAGVRIPPADLVLAPTPPPDIDVEAWRESIDLVRSWEPTSLGITHFGAVEEPVAQLQAVRDCLDRWSEAARGLDHEEFERLVRDEIRGGADRETAAAYEQAIPPEQPYLGLSRYWRKRLGAHDG
jgi:glyoxylase-like metal-dependent hydrolase (beta-lactamase superfamily II)